jgi:hypothetical protein
VRGRADEAAARRKELLDLYKIAIEEYRFEVRLSWDRMQYYVVVSSGILAVAIGLVKDVKSAPAALLAAALFLVGVLTSIVGVYAILKGRDYYHETIFKKTVYEHVLGLNKAVAGVPNPEATLGIATTGGMKNSAEILAGRKRKNLVSHFFRARVYTYVMWLLLLLAAVDSAGIAYAAHRAANIPGETSPVVRVEGPVVLLHRQLTELSLIPKSVESRPPISPWPQQAAGSNPTKAGVGQP